MWSAWMEVPFMAESASSGEFYALASANVWALAVILFRLAGRDTRPVVLNLFKSTLGFVMLVGTMILTNKSLFPPDVDLWDWAVLAGSGFLGIALADSMVFFSLNRLGAGGAALVECAYSPMVVVFAVLYLGEGVSWRLVVSMFMVLGAILIDLRGREEPDRPRERRELVLGAVVGLGAVALMAGTIVSIKPLLGRVDVWWATTIRLVGALPVLWVVGLSRRYRDDTLKTFTPGPRWWILVPGTFLGAYVTVLLWLLGFKYADAGIAGVLNQTSTFTIMLLATLVLREPMTRHRTVAMLLGFGGAAIAMG